MYTEEFNDDDDDNDDDEDDDDEDDAEEANIDRTDYNSNYDEDTFSLPIFGARPSDFPDSSSTIAPVPSPPDPPIADETLMKLTLPRRTKQSEESKENDSSRDRGRDKNNLEGETKDHKNDTMKRKRDVLEASDNTKDFLLDWKITLKRKRSIDEKNHSSKRLLVNRHLLKNHTKRTIASDPTSDREMEKSGQDEQNMLVVNIL